MAFKPKKLNEAQLLHAHRALWKKSFSPLYAFKRIVRGLFTLRMGAFLLSLFMNSFYSYKRIRKNYPIDMSRRADMSRLVKPLIKADNTKILNEAKTLAKSAAI